MQIIQVHLITQDILIHYQLHVTNVVPFSCKYFHGKQSCLTLLQMVNKLCLCRETQGLITIMTRAGYFPSAHPDESNHRSSTLFY
jgi:hypothetical protein